MGDILEELLCPQGIDFHVVVGHGLRAVEGQGQRAAAASDVGRPESCQDQVGQQQFCRRRAGCPARN